MKTVFAAAAFALAVLPLQAAVACEGSQQAAASSPAQSMPPAAAQTPHVVWQYQYVGYHPHLEGHWVAVN